eukprot:jgi/Tetstr1/428628/TSEL_018617.t1
MAGESSGSARAAAVRQLGNPPSQAEIAALHNVHPCPLNADGSRSTATGHRIVSVTLQEAGQLLAVRQLLAAGGKVEKVSQHYQAINTKMLKMMGTVLDGVESGAVPVEVATAAFGAGWVHDTEGRTVIELPPEVLAGYVSARRWHTNCLASLSKVTHAGASQRPDSTAASKSAHMPPPPPRVAASAPTAAAPTPTPIPPNTSAAPALRTVIAIPTASTAPASTPSAPPVVPAPAAAPLPAQPQPPAAAAAAAAAAPAPAQGADEYWRKAQAAAAAELKVRSPEAFALVMKLLERGAPECDRERRAALDEVRRTLPAAAPLVHATAQRSRLRRLTALPKPPSKQQAAAPAISAAPGEPPAAALALAADPAPAPPAAHATSPSPEPQASAERPTITRGPRLAARQRPAPSTPPRPEESLPAAAAPDIGRSTREPTPPVPESSPQEVTVPCVATQAPASITAAPPFAPHQPPPPSATPHPEQSPLASAAPEVGEVAPMPAEAHAAAPCPPAEPAQLRAMPAAPTRAGSLAAWLPPEAPQPTAPTSAPPDPPPPAPPTQRGSPTASPGPPEPQLPAAPGAEDQDAIPGSKRRRAEAAAATSSCAEGPDAGLGSKQSRAEAATSSGADLEVATPPPAKRAREGGTYAGANEKGDTWYSDGDQDGFVQPARFSPAPEQPPSHTDRPADVPPPAGQGGGDDGGPVLPAFDAGTSEGEGGAPGEAAEGAEEVAHKASVMAAAAPIVFLEDGDGSDGEEIMEL